ncbi:MAG: GAF domain-containing protein, partial [Bacteroidia bacterium]
VCGTAWKNKEVIIVDDVDAFPGHIACSSASKSEIVLPVYNKNGEVIAILDLDDDEYATFDHIDKEHLSSIISLVENLFH